MSDLDEIAQRKARLAARRAALSGAQKAHLEKRLQGESGDALIPRRPGQGPARLSFAQQRLWFLSQLEPASPFYNIPAAVRLTGMLDVVVLEKSLDEIARRHETLRTTFRLQDGEKNPVQIIAPTFKLALPVIDLRDIPEIEREAQVQSLAAREARQPFDLACGPLVRATIVRLGEREHALLLTMHHIISDGWSAAVLIREVVALYQAFIAGEPSPLPELPIQYADFAVWQREWLQGDALAAQLDYWKQQLAGAPALLGLPTDHPRPPIQTFRGATHSFTLTHALAEALQALSRQAGTTMFMTLLAAFKLLLWRYTGQTDIVVGCPIANRNRTEIEGLIGFFVNTLVLRTDLDTLTFRELLGQVREVTLGAYAHQDLPFEKLVEELQPERDLSRNLMFQVTFAFQNAPTKTADLPGLTARLLEVESSTAKFDLALSIAELEDGLSGLVEYSTDLFEAATITLMMGHFQAVLESVVADPDQHLLDLPLMAKAERRRVLIEWNNTWAEYSQDVCLPDLFEKQVERTPDSTALVYESEYCTYQALNQRANQLAHYLQSLGVGPEARVGLYMERSLDMLVGVWGILKAGGAYVPLDPMYPPERLAFMLKDAQPHIVLTLDRMRQLPAHTAQTVSLDADWGIIARYSGDNLVQQVAADNMAYVIYTSGSTGTPKGVVIRHRSLINLSAGLYYAIYAHRSASPLRVSLNGPLAFDTSVKQWLQLLYGHELDIVPEDVRLEGSELLAYLQRNKLDVLDCTPSQLELLIAAGLLKGPAPGCILVGGEPISQPLWQALAQSAHIDFYNVYGPTECTVDATVCRVGARSLPVIGRPINNVQIYILDRRLQPAPVGVPGELYVGGDGLARGYLNQPTLTAEKFIPNPFVSPRLWEEIEGGRQAGGGSRLYKTGDLARYLPDGHIEFLGRVDHQIKIRGFRIELSEIEAVLRQYPAIQEAVVITRSDKQTLRRDERLVAYVVPKPDQIPTSDQLRSFLQTKLPLYMLPSAFVVLNALPLTSHGKLDRQALPAPSLARLGLETGATPRTVTEEMLVSIWAEILGLEHVGIHDNFFELGGHSLLASQIVSRIRRVFQIELALRTLFEKPTIADLAGSIEAAQRAGLGLIAPPMLPVGRDGKLPLSFAQQRLWFLDQLEPNNPAYNIALAARLIGPLDAAVLEQSLDEIVRRHESLRTTFAMSEGQAVQIINPPSTMRLPIADLRELPTSERQTLILRLAKEEAQRPFDLDRGPLVRGSLLWLDNHEHALFLTMHHIVSDGWSMRIFVREMAALYEAFSAGLPSPLPALPIQYADYAVWQRQWLQGDVLKTQLAYWKQQLEGAPAAMELPSDYPRPPIQTFRGAFQSLVLPQTLSHALRALSWQQGTTLFMTLLAAFKVLLYLHTGQSDVIVGAPIANRNWGETEDLIGFFINTLVLRTSLSSDCAFVELLSRVREVTLGAYAHQDLPFEKLVEELQPDRDLSRTPLFQVFFNMLNLAPGDIQSHQLKIEPLSPAAIDPDVESKFDLTLYVENQADGTIRFDMVYNADLFARARMIEMLEQFQLLLKQVVEQPGQKICHFSLMTPKAKALLPDPTQMIDAAWEQAVHVQFSRQASRAPHRLAVVDKDGNWTYEELDKRSNRLSNHLRASSICSQDLVAVYGHRSASIIWALLGILKAGAAFVILDPAYPASSLIARLRQAPIRAWLQVEAAGALPKELEQFITAASYQCRLVLPSSSLAAAFAPLAECSPDDPQVAVEPDDLAYVAFTSGTTGKPRGILGTHRPLSHFVQWHSQTFNLCEADRFNMLSGLAHDPLLRDIFTPLCLGAALCIPGPDDIESVGSLAEWMQRQAIGVTHLTPAMAQLVAITRQPMVLSNLRYVFFGGDVLTQSDIDKIQALAPKATCVNFYGATETPQAMGYYVIPNHETAGDGSALESNRLRKAAPLGQGIEAVQLLVLNASQQLAGIGQVGEICIRTPYLARGYLNDNELTRQRFVPNPFTSMAGDRLYKSGDLGRYLPDGNIEFVGRADHQLKLRGFRVEPEEIEEILMQHPAVLEAAVVARETVNRPGEKQLAAYLVFKPGQPPDVGELRIFLSERLPKYMLPAAIVALEAMPLTPNKKVDRQALPAPESIGSDSAKRRIPPRDDLEFRLVQIWQEVLRVQSIGVKCNFFELGGHSLLAVQLVARITQELGQQLPLAALFQAPTVEQLACVLRRHARANIPFSSLAPMQTGDSAKCPLFLVHPAGGNVLCYADLARQLGLDQPVYGLQAIGLSGEQPPHTQIEAMASHYAELLRTVQPQKPCLLGGWSMGGVIAFEMARQLYAQGQQVAALILIDSHAPTGQPASKADDVDLLINLVMEEGLHVDPDYLRQLDEDEQLAYVLKEAKRANALPPDVTVAQMHNLFQVLKSNMQALRQYAARPYPGAITLCKASKQWDERKDLGWEGLAGGGLVTYEIPGDHYTIMREPGVTLLAEQIKVLLDLASK